MEISYQNIPEYKIFKEEFCVDNCNIWYFEYSFIENDCIYIDYIYINSNYRWNWYWDKLIQSINNFIEGQWKFWILQNSLNSNYLYEKNKWIQTGNSNFLYYSGKLNLETKYVVDKIINYQI